MLYILRTACCLLLFTFGWFLAQSQDIKSFKIKHNQYIFHGMAMDDVWHWNTNRFPVSLVTQADKYGYIDTTGKEVIPCQYAYAGKFTHGLALVQYDNKYGFINHEGATIIPFIYDDAGPFINGTASVAQYHTRQGEKVLQWITIDTTGKTIKYN